MSEHESDTEEQQELDLSKASLQPRLTLCRRRRVWADWTEFDLVLCSQTW